MLKKFTKNQQNQESITGLDAVKLAQLLEASPNEVYIFDGETLNIEYGNPRATEHLGYSLEELQTMSVFEVKRELTEEVLSQQIAPLLQKETTQIKLETNHYRKDGTKYPIEAYVQLIPEEKGAKFFAIAVDISQRKIAENSLKEKAEQLESIANNIPGIIYQLRYSADGETNVEYVSDRVETILALSKEAIYNDFNNFLKLVHPDDRPDLISTLKKKAVDLTPLFWEGRVITDSDRLVWLQARSQAEKQADGSIIRSGVLLDITPQKEAEIARRESEETFRQFAQNIDDIFWMIDPKSQKLVYVSPAYEKICGYSEDYIKRNPLNFLQPIHPEDRYLVKAILSQPILQKYDADYRVVRPNGEIRWLRDRAFPVKNEQEEIYRIAGIAQDITEQKKAEIEIYHNRQLREVIFNEATDALYLVDPETLKILDCNQRAVELLKAPTKSSLLNTHANPFYKVPFSRIKQVIEERNIWKEEIILNTVEGDTFWGDIAWKGIQVNERNLYLVRVSDISERKAFETELQITNECLELTNQELARATRLKDEFLANMSHELRTPLNAILGMSEGLQESSPQAINAQQKSVIKSIKTSAKHLLDLINDILDLAKIQAGKISLNYTQVNLQSLCENSLNFVKQQAYRKGITLQNKIETSCSVLNVDELRMRQILINLLSNAVKFTSEGGEVTLSVTEDWQEGQIIFAVADTGIGISREEIDRLFEPFVQLDSQLNRHYPGTGLGLSLVRRLSELHGGSISVKSKLGKGSIFEVKLPYSQVTTVCKKSPSNSYSQQVTNVSVSPSILVFNSDRPLLDTTSSYLEASGYEVIAVGDEKALFSALKESSPQIIVIDFDNFEASENNILQRLRQKPSLAETSIITLTSKNTSNIKEDMLASGANVSLIKPIRLRHLLIEIQCLLP